ncbi:sugar fermentation stimulation protein A [Caloramator fervidus]|uniref:Sugar fermentation stimulation protein homolog n=1 Tax=Caloramator fervidus TaxID=29344 RepID=A0A1H5TDG7_9CLOT|nr:sugar fermentation stimulation protein A [Caloramator fervidus]
MVGFKIEGKKVEGRFVKRLNRFEAIVEIGKNYELCHVPNTGRLKELLVEDAKIYLVKNDKKNRKTKWTLMFVEKKDGLVCINSSMANNVLECALRDNTISLGEGIIKREENFLKSKFDFFIDGPFKTFIEVKCATFEQNKIAKFPDAPTERGKKHIEELIKAVQMGYKAKIVFIAFMDFVNCFEPYKDIDEKFAFLLKEAYKKGVEILAYKCSITLDEVSISDKIPVNINC